MCNSRHFPLNNVQLKLPTVVHMNYMRLHLKYGVLHLHSHTLDCSQHSALESCAMEIKMGQKRKTMKKNEN